MLAEVDALDGVLEGERLTSKTEIGLINKRGRIRTAAVSAEQDIIESQRRQVTASKTAKKDEKVELEDSLKAMKLKHASSVKVYQRMKMLSFGGFLASQWGAPSWVKAGMMGIAALSFAAEKSPVIASYSLEAGKAFTRKIDSSPHITRIMKESLKTLIREGSGLNPTPQEETPQ